MKVKNLIKRLQEFNPDDKVYFQTEDGLCRVRNISLQQSPKLEETMWVWTEDENTIDSEVFKWKYFVLLSWKDWEK